MQLRLKIIWLNKVLGFALDQKGKQNSYPLTPYYFWPRVKVWDQLKLELDSKLMVKEEEKIKILNLVTDVMNSWRNKNTKVQKIYFTDVEYVEIQN